MNHGWGSSIKYVRKIFRKANISNPLIRTCAYQGVRNVSLSENFAYVLNGWPHVSTNGKTKMKYPDFNIQINLFVPNAPFLYSLKTSENLMVF